VVLVTKTYSVLENVLGKFISFIIMKLLIVNHGEYRGDTDAADVYNGDKRKGKRK
jgi:hypothetical protein